MFISLICYFGLHAVFCHIALTKYKLTPNVLKVSVIYSVICSLFYFLPWYQLGLGELSEYELFEFLPGILLMIYVGKKLGYSDEYTLLIPCAVFFGASIFHMMFMAIIFR